MAEELRLRWGLQQSQTHLTVAIFRGETLVGQLDLSPDSVLQAIRGFAELRQQMIRPEYGAAAEAPPVELVNPLWTVKSDPGREGPELLLNHPGFGVLGFVFPRAEAEKLARQLQAALATPAAKPN
jgi:hypothetical protein